MKRISLILLCLFVTSCFAQNDSIVINIRGLNITMMKVEGGSYKRGCNPQALQHDSCCFTQNRGENTVTLKSFYLAKFEVTQELYKQITGKNPSWFKSYKEYGPCTNLPVESVSWYDTQDFIDSLNVLTGKHFRLPTEAEWEYAARGGHFYESYYYSGSDDLKVVTHCGIDIIDGLVPNCWTSPVGGKMPNSLGLYDMTGNVSEWCSDWYDSTYYQFQNKFNNPKGPKEGDKKVVRGGDGSTHNLPTLDVRYRKGLDLSTRKMHLGFRLAMDAE